MQNFFEILPEKTGTAIALGYFDGLHKGHRNVISLAAAEKENGLTPVCFTFSKSPKSVLNGTQSNALMTSEDKIKTLERLGIERTYQADFEKIMNMPAQDFAQKILIDTLKAEKLFCGFNYRYGKNGFGDVNLLNLVAKHYKVKVNVVDFLLDTADKKISTSTVKQYLSVGNVEAANGLLGEAYHITGVVEKNFGRGKALGFPTANIDIPPEKMCIRHGVYATTTVVDGKSYESITNVGDKPTFGVTDVNTETYLIDFDGDLYGKTITVKFFKFIRGIQKYDSKEQLILRLSKDIVESGAIKRF